MIEIILPGLFAAVCAYLLGSVSSAVLVSHFYGLPDPRNVGSGNPGATNVLRSGNKIAAALTLVGDFLKGLVAVLLTAYFTKSSTIIAIAGLAAFLGHLYPIFFNFRGGKGVATALGVIFAIDWISGALSVATWLAVALCFRYSSLAALTTFIAAPAYIWLSTGDFILTTSVSIMGLGLFWRHRSNIMKLTRGEETKLGRQ